MLEFICSTCGKRIQGDESLAGKRVLCPVCNAAMTIPQHAEASPATAVATPEHAVQAKITLQAAANGGTFREGLPLRDDAPLPPSRKEVPHILMCSLPYLIVAGMVLIVVGLCIPIVQKVREVSIRTQSTNNLKFIGLVFHSFHDANKRLPYNGTKTPYLVKGERRGGPALAGDFTTGSWAFMIASYIDQNPIFSEKDTNVSVSIYMCPGRGRPFLCKGVGGPGAWTDYFINSFLNDPNGAPDAPDARLTLVGITDGTSNTILVGQGQINPEDYSLIDVTPGFSDIIFNGGSPALCRGNRVVVNARDSSDPPSMPGNWGGPFRQGSLMCLGDATVRMFPYSMRGGTITAGVCDGNHFGQFGTFLTPNGGEPVTIRCD